MLVNRTLKAQIKECFFKNKAIIIFGPRQVGKTTLVEDLLKDFKEPIIRFNGDESDIRELLTNPTSSMLKTLTAGKEIVLIDEAQRIENIGITVKLFVDTMPEKQIIATGSSSFELANKINEPLTGRKYEVMLFPLSFSEMTRYHGLLEEKRQLEQRLVFGSYPEIVTNPKEAKQNLKALAGSYLYKDILSFCSIQKPVVLEKILKALALQLGSEVKYSELANLIGVDKQTIEKYIDILEKAFILFRLPALNRNIRNEIKKGKKIYFFDNGIRNAVIGNFTHTRLRTDIGALWENYLVSERKKVFSYGNSDVFPYFWRTVQQQEIDYIEEDSGIISAWEFKWNQKTKVKFSKTFVSNYSPVTTSIISPSNFEELLLNDQ
jgi:predicted AAA+ superfamily ATPase